MNIEESKSLLSWVNINKLYIDTHNECDYHKIHTAIEILLTAYEKEKGENVKLRLQDIPLMEGEVKAYKDRVNELKQELEKEKEKNKELNRLKGFEMLDIFNMGKQSSRQRIEFDYVDKEKIKAKIEEVEQWELHNMKIPKLNTLEERLGAKIGIKYVLQSLLDKG